MVVCAIVGCLNRSKRDRDVYFCRFHTVFFHQGWTDVKLRKKWRDGYLAAMSRKDLRLESLENCRNCLDTL